MHKDVIGVILKSNAKIIGRIVKTYKENEEYLVCPIVVLDDYSGLYERDEYYKFTLENARFVFDQESIMKIHETNF